MSSLDVVVDLTSADSALGSTEVRKYQFILIGKIPQWKDC